MGRRWFGRRGFGRRAGRLVALLVAGLTSFVLVVGSAAPASAHTELVRSSPPNGGMVPEGETTVTLWFDETIGGPATSVTVSTLGGLRVETTVEVGSDEQSLVVHTPALARGSYVVDWRVLSLVDGHASSGQVVFGAGLRPDVVATSGESPPTELLVARWIDLAALLVAVGAVVVGGRVLRAGGDATAGLRRRVRRYAAWAAAVACYSGILTAFLRTRAAGAPLQAWADQTWLSLTSTTWGQLWMLREAALVVAAAALWRWRRVGDADRARMLGLGALVVAVVLEGFAGHAAGLPQGSSVAALAGALHVLAAGVWAGGLVVLAAVLLTRRNRRGPAAQVGSAGGSRGGVWRAYSPRAAVASGVLLATGLYEAGRHVPSVDALGSGLYGRAVVAKALLFAVAIGLAAVNTSFVHPRLVEGLPGLRGLVPVTERAPRRFPHTLVLEAGVLVAAVLAAGLLTSVPTAREVALATRPALPHSENVDGLFVTVEAVPDGPGQRRLVVRAEPTVLPEQAPVYAADATVVGPDGTTETLALPAADGGQLEGSVPTDRAGHWSAELRLHRQAAPDTTVSTSWEQSATADQLPHTLRTLTGLLALSVLAAMVLTGLLLRRRRTPPDAPAQSNPTLERSMS